eukprot:1926838-Rhodomonas_salina.1
MGHCVRPNVSVWRSRTEFVIFLEDDWILPYGEPKWRPLLQASLTLLARGAAGRVQRCLWRRCCCLWAPCCCLWRQMCCFCGGIAAKSGAV